MLNLSLPNQRRRRTAPAAAALLALTLVVSLFAAAPARAQHEPAPATPAAAALAGTEQHPADAHAPGEKHYELIPDVMNSAEERTEARNNAIWVLIIFAILCCILYFTAWKNVLAGLKKREERIRKDIADAEEARLKAESTLKQYTQQISAAEKQVSEMLARATAEGDKISAGIKAQAQKEVEEMRDRANRDIQATRDQALAEIYQKTAELSTQIAEKIIRRNLNVDDQRDLVNQSLQQLQTVGSK